MIDIDNIEAKARSAGDVDAISGGPWRHIAVRHMQHEIHGITPDPTEGEALAYCENRVIGEHIASSSPWAILALCAELRQARKARDELRETLRTECATGAEYQRLWAEVSAERDAYREMLADLVAATTAKAAKTPTVFARAVSMLKNGPPAADTSSVKGGEQP